MIAEVKTVHVINSTPNRAKEISFYFLNATSSIREANFDLLEPKMAHSHDLRKLLFRIFGKTGHSSELVRQTIGKEQTKQESIKMEMF